MYHPELNETTVTVRPDGFINLQLVDDVAAAGLTISELKTRLEKEYDETLINPVISVALLEFVAPRVYIGGQVGKPGRYELRDGQTLIEVIFLAGRNLPKIPTAKMFCARDPTARRMANRIGGCPENSQPKKRRKRLIFAGRRFIFMCRTQTFAAE